MLSSLTYRIIGTILLAGAVVQPLNAQDGGSTAYNFLNVTSSAKIYGLGGVNISLVDDDINVIDQNPALLGSEMSNTASVNYMRYLGGSNFLKRPLRTLGRRTRSVVLPYSTSAMAR